MGKVILVFISVLLFACENKEKETPLDNSLEVQPEFNVTINFKTNKADEFRLKLNNIIIDEFQKKNIEIVEKVVASNNTDIIKAKFGPNNISKNFQIGLGNKEIKEIEIETIELSFGKNSIIIKASELADYFIFNKYASIEDGTFKIVTKKVNGKHAPKVTLNGKTLMQLFAKS
jgi:hypothetical protein